MKNRFNIEFKKGYKVVCHNPRGGTTGGVISSIGKDERVALGFGASFAADDIISSVKPLKKGKQLFYVEFTDTYGGEANYSWIYRFMVHASTMRGAIGKVTKETGHKARKDYDVGDTSRYNVPGACVCYFVSHSEGEERHIYSSVKEL